ncbi:MAG TPA: hypothetical protein VLE99_06635 [Candidatus Saccharimonadales bacterium]|nr:hypothetical protein [Candidatus Saccharimonadales bacterium]
MSTTPSTTKLAQIRQLLAWYEQGLIPRLAQHEVNPGLPLGSRENYLYFTLPVCINFQRSSPAMWAAALKTWEDAETRYVFFPEQLATHSMEQIRADLLKHKLALQPNKHVLIWTTIARTLHEYYDDDPRQVITEAEGDAGRLIQLLQVTHRKRFPYLSGPKLSNYWPYILSHYTDVQFANAHEISIIPDTHVLQSSVRLGVTSPAASPRETETAWRALLADSGLTPAQVHPVLWNWSRNHFSPTPEE